MDGVLFGVLSGGVHEYLRGVVGAVAPDRGPEPPEVFRLAAAWRALLRMHELGVDGRCVLCGRGRARWWSARREPSELCSVWQVAVGYFVRRLPGERR